MTTFLLQILCFTQNRSNPTGTDFAAKITKFQDLGKQRERSLCSLEIEIPTNFPTNLNSEQNSYHKTFSSSKFKNEHNASRTTKIRDLGKQRERSLCSRKTRISTNYPASPVRTKILCRTQKFKRHTQHAQDLVTLFTKHSKIVLQVTQALLSKKQFFRP